MTSEQILKAYWGYESFRPLQADIIRSVLNGEDCLALLPTGGGKSLCYQVPALQMDGICIVISPLLSLMADQVEQLKARGIKAMAVNSFMNKKQIDHALDSAVYGDFKLLYISPERIQTEMFQERLKKMKVSFIAVDEAHCISQWGYDFRPSYLQIGQLRELTADIGILALTATATTDVVGDIMDKLSFRGEKVFRKSYARDNLSIQVFRKEDKRNFLVQKLKSLNGSSIVYARNRKRCRELAEFLQSEGIEASYYHAGLNHEERMERQREWAGSSGMCMVATNAFGMGIDKADVRCVIHVDLPDTLEAYYQEAGRAGRDGKPCQAITLFSEGDVRKLRDNFRKSYPPMEEIRRVYQNLCNHLQVAMHEGQGQSFTLDMGEVCEKYKLKKSLLYHGLKQLQAASYLDLSEGFDQASKVMVTASRSALSVLGNEKLSKIMEYLLRSYSAILDEAVAIDELPMARRLNTSADEVRKGLDYLHKASYLEYNPGHDLPGITFLSDRIRPNEIRFGRQQKDLKAHAEMRLQSVLDFMKEKKICRMQSILSYFGEAEAPPCGHCDVCQGRFKAMDRKTSNALTDAILASLKDLGDIGVSELEYRIQGYPEGEVVRRCRELLDRGILKLDGDRLGLVRP